MALLLEIAKESGELSKFLALIEEVRLEGTFGGSGPFTLFAPSDAAFASAPQDLLQEHTKMLYHVRNFVLHHVIVAEIKNADICREKYLRNMAGGELTVIDDYGIVRVSGAKIISPDHIAENGILHIIERVLWPKLSDSS